jgi:hypothetical protein|tara:strand:+ start:217 stop:615 length:399 start_codon:yes stop_codon:yes gene_type:complete
MKTFTESQNILLKRQLLIPTLLRHSDSQNNLLIDALEKCDEYNEYLTGGDLQSALEHLPYAAQSLIRYAEETALRKDERQIKYGLELRKKDAQINAIKSFNDFSKKIQPTSKNKPTDKLSDAEKKIIKSFSK